MKNKITLQEAERISRAFNNDLYWINAMVKLKMIQPSEAGYIIIKDRI